MTYTYTYKSDYEDTVKLVELPNDVISISESDALGRLTNHTINNVALSTAYEYCSNKNNSAYTTPLVLKETHTKIGSQFAAYQYTYDSNNNILTVKDGSNALLVSYEYDGLNRLIRENIVGGDTTVFKYDKGGNQQYKKVYAYSTAAGKTYNDLLNGSGKTISYGYGIASNKDLLTSYNGSGTLEYDNYGNPKKWFKHGTGNSSLGYTLQWGNVSNLTAVTDTSNGKRYTYKYNDQGIRTEKVVNGVVHKYYLQGKQIIAEKIGSTLIKFYYDTTGVCGFNYNGTDYYYLKNIQGDILRIYSNGGTLYAEYSYDAWGKCTIKTNVSGIATINPFRYRGYYYDTETKLYYLNARYYDPEIGRFISPDKINSLMLATNNGINLYIYCLNNPVKYYDKAGNNPELAIEAEIFFLFYSSGQVWQSDKYIPTHSFSGNPWNDLIPSAEILLSQLSGSAISYTAKGLYITSSEFSLFVVEVNLFGGRLNLNDTDSLGLKLGTAELEFLSLSFANNLKISLLDAQVTALSVGYYTNNVDAEVLIGSIGGTLKWDNGKLIIGISYGLGVKITIRFW